MTNSYRQILRSSSIIGGASVVNILIGLIRMKVAAVTLGPAGVGLIGLFTNLVATGASFAGLGLGTVGTRHIAEAEAQQDPSRVWIARRALFWLTLALALLGGVGFWLLRGLLAEKVLGDESLSGTLGWLSVAVAVSVAAASQNALLNGMRRIGDIARVTIYSAALSATIGVAALWLMGQAGIVVFVLVSPVASLVLGHWYVSKLPRPARSSFCWADLSTACRGMLRLGMSFMLAGLAGVFGQLAVRTLIQRDLGADALGQFQAAWAISMTYIGFVLGAMGTDYYPRLTAVIQDPREVNKLVNEQTEVALLLAAPVLLAMLALAPWVIRLLYSAEFMGAVEILRWHVLGDILKIVSWPLGFILLASGSGKTFMGTEWLSMALFFILTLVLLPTLGISATGVSFFAMYLVLLVVVWALAVRRTAFTWSSRVKLYGVAILSCASAIHILAQRSEVAAAALGVGLAVGSGLFAMARLAQAGELSGSASKLARISRVLMTRRGGWHE